MSGWNRPRSVAAAIGLCGLLSGVPTLVRADDGPDAPYPRVVVSDPVKLRSDAEAAEKAGRWEKALDLYLKLYVQGGSSAEIREKVRICLRNASQLHRHRDPAFQQFVLSLPTADALNIYAEAVTKIGALYVDRDKAAPGKLFTWGLDELDRALADSAFRDRHADAVADAKYQRFRQALRGSWRTRLPASPREARHAARELVLAAQEEAGLRNPSVAVLELICGACGGLDEYSLYLTPTAAQAELASPIAEFAGYGILIRFRGKDLIVDGLVPGSWAATALPGLRKGDRIVRVNGQAMAPATPAALTEAIRSSSMFGHDVEVAAAGMSARAQLPIPVPSVYLVDQPGLKDGVKYVRVSAFRDNTPQELEAIILSQPGLRALVLDLRNNPGGHFSASVQLAQRFLPAGIVVSTQGQASEFAGRVFSSDVGMSAWDFPLVLLVDARTMSAAEVVAVALKDNGRATLVGLPTFGKGVIQSPIRLQALDATDGKAGVLILTVANVLGPRGLPLNGGGVMPHVLEANPNRQLELAISKALEMIGSR